MLRRLYSRQCSIRDGDLQVSAHVIAMEDQLSLTPEVVDGLKKLFPQQIGAERLGKPPEPVDIEMLSGTEVCDLPIFDGMPLPVRQGKLVAAPSLRSRAVILGPAKARALEAFRFRPAEIAGDDRMLLPLPSIRSTDQISKLPQRRRSVDLEKLEDSERKGFLHEAEVLRHVPAERSELLAVFRNVPIEIIARLRFLSEPREILYSIEGPPRAQTRLHDIAAVRDNADQEVHIVAHRTRSRQVVL